MDVNPLFVTTVRLGKKFTLSFKSPFMVNISNGLPQKMFIHVGRLWVSSIKINDTKRYDDYCNVLSEQEPRL